MTTSTHITSPAAMKTETEAVSFAAVVSSAFVGNPRRTRGLDAAMLALPARPSTMVGNPRRLRGIDATVLAD